MMTTMMMMMRRRSRRRRRTTTTRSRTQEWTWALMPAAAAYSPRPRWHCPRKRRVGGGEGGAERSVLSPHMLEGGGRDGHAVLHEGPLLEVRRALALQLLAALAVVGRADHHELLMP
jgi:hypothetical protein